MIPIQKDATIADALKIFATKGVHRLPIMDNDKLIKVLTASAVVNWLASVDLDRFGKRSIKDLNLGVKEVFTVTTQTRAIDAFRLIFGVNVV
jgi:CBS domain-containing protein